MIIKIFENNYINIIGDRDICEKVLYYSEPYFIKGEENHKISFNIYLEKMELFDSLPVKSDYSFLGYKYWENKDDAIVIWDNYSQSTLFTILDRRIYVSYIDSEKIAYDIFRFLRNLSTDLIKEKYPVIHGSCFEYNKRGLLVIGNKFSGKTTVLLDSILHNKNVKFVTNDIGYFDFESKFYKGIPKAVSIRNSSLDYFDIKINSKYNYASSCNSLDWKGKNRLSTKEFCEIFNCGSTSETTIYKIIYLIYSTENKIEKIDSISKKYELFKRQIIHINEGLMQPLDICIQEMLDNTDFYIVYWDHLNRIEILNSIRKIYLRD